MNLSSHGTIHLSSYGKQRKKQNVQPRHIRNGNIDSVRGQPTPTSWGSYAARGYRAEDFASRHIPSRTCITKECNEDVCRLSQNFCRGCHFNNFNNN